MWNHFTKRTFNTKQCSSNNWPQRWLELAYRVNRLLKIILSFLVLAIATDVLCAQFGSGHKSKDEIGRMTPQQRVEEYVREDLRHKHDLDDNYHDVLFSYIRRDGIEVVAEIVKIIDEYDPTQGKGRGKDKGERYDAAWILLSDIDGTVIRLRASEEGRIGIEAMKRVVERMRAAHFDNSESYDYEKQGRYKLAVIALTGMEGINMRDEAVRDTLRLRYKISLSDKELLDFIDYVISQDPSYPSSMVTELYKDREQLNDAGNPLQYVIVKNVEPFHKLYLQYKAKASHAK
jgi:hypothetical protein